MPRAADETMADPDLATTLVKGLKVLEAFRVDSATMTNAQIAAHTGIHRATVTRLTYTLTTLGYLKQEKSRLRLGWRALMLVNPLLANLKLLHIARPLMQELAQDVGGTVSLGTIDGSNFVYLETARVNANLWPTPDVGTIGPLLPAAIGQALVSLLDDDALALKVEALRRGLPELWEKYGDFFTQGVASCRSRGFTTAKGVWVPGTHSAGAPLVRDDNGECFAVNCRVPVFRLSPNQIEEEIGPRIASLAANVRDQFRQLAPD